MGESGLLSRIGSIFKRGNRAAAEEDDGLPGLVAGKPGLTKPMNPRDRAMSNLQEGFDTLTGLMTGIKQNMSDQGRRSDELLGYLSHLPEALKGIPETNRLQVESLKAISARLDQQNEQQQLIAEVLGKMADADEKRQKAVEEIGSRVETVAEQNKNIAENLTTVGSAMTNVSQTSKASAAVLTQLRDSFEQRDGQIERILHKQASRFTTMLVVAIVLSAAALAAVAVVGFKMMAGK